MLLGTLGASLSTGTGLFRAGRGIFRVEQGIFKKSLIPFHPLTNFEIIDYFKDERIFNGVFSRNNLPKIKKGAYVINLDHNKNIGTHWVVTFMKENEVIYFDSFGVENIPEEIMKVTESVTRFSGNKNIKTNILC